MARTLIVLPTYNRSNVLRLAVLSVVRQQEQDWQLLVIADGCTDDTAEVMAQFSDGRVHFINSKENSGNMARPINWAVAEGLRRWPETKCIALLSHDDLWLPDHLVNLQKAIDRGANFALAPYFECLPANAMAQRHAANTKYDVWLKPVTMSTWMVCAKLWQKIGAWRAPREIIDTPSADWRFRAWQHGARFKFSEQASVIVINSVVHAGSYKNRVDTEQRFWANKLDHPDLRLLLQQAVVESKLRSHPVEQRPPERLAGRVLRSLRFRTWRALSLLLRRIAPYIGVSPGSVEFWMAGHRRGSVVERLMRERGLRDP